VGEDHAEAGAARRTKEALADPLDLLDRDGPLLRGGEREAGVGAELGDLVGVEQRQDLVQVRLDLDAVDVQLVRGDLRGLQRARPRAGEQALELALRRLDQLDQATTGARGLTSAERGQAPDGVAVIAGPLVVAVSDEQDPAVDDFEAHERGPLLVTRARPELPNTGASVRGQLRGGVGVQTRSPQPPPQRSSPAIRRSLSRRGSALIA
jgi:hypothetical protein